MKITLWGLILAVCVLTGCATGSHVVTGTARPITDAAGVKVYATMPDKAETIGVVNSNSGSNSRAVEELKNQAGRLGANGVVIGVSLGDVWNGYHYSGTAIYVPQ